MPLQLIPVLEIRHGKCVHTEPKNSYSDQVVREDVLEVIEHWVTSGVRRIHLVDVDAVESGEPENVDIIQVIKARFPKLEIQVLGGIRSTESAYIWFDGGADFIVLTGRAFRQKNLLDDLCVEFPERIWVELDCRDGKVGLGSGEPTMRLASLARQLEEDGVAGIVVTQIPETGHVNNASLLSVGEIAKQVEIPLFANGGIENLDNLKSLLDAQAEKISGVLIGKPLYNGFDLSQAHQLIDQAVSAFS